MKILILLILTNQFIFSQNEVCFEILPNPEPNSPALASFTKYINVLDCIHIYAENTISDPKVLHAASVAAELLDNNEDGIVDDLSIKEALSANEAMMPIFSNEWSQSMDDVEDYYNGCIGAVLFRNEIDPSQPGHWGDDATVEEILHTINVCGHVEVYPEAFNLGPNTSLLSDAMDVARGGQFINIPNEYPEEAWYHYDDWTCDYECMAVEYMYWCLVSHMGILNDTQTCNGIDNEWELCTPELFASTDIAMYNIIIDAQYVLPQIAPDGNYCPTTNLLGDVNFDGNLDILDVIMTINIILGILQENENADINQDNNINILDVIALSNIILEN